MMSRSAAPRLSHLDGSQGYGPKLSKQPADTLSGLDSNMTAARYVCIKKFAELTGYSEKAVYHKIERGVWVEGHQYRRPSDNRILIDLVGYGRWVEGGQALGLNP